MKVWTLTHYYDYDHERLIGIYATEAQATAAALAEDPQALAQFSDYSINEHEVQDA